MVRRGFAASADRLGASVRNELGLGVHDRLDPSRLADQYGVPIVPITELVDEGADPASVHQLTKADPACFSAGTVFADTVRLIIFNPVHPDGRLANSLTHELSHLLLEHTAGPAIGPGGCRVWDQEMEDEANLLAAVLLVPRDAALACARVGLPHAIGAARFGVSTDLMRWRTDHSGASRQAHAAARRWGHPIPRLSAPDLRSVLDECELGLLQDISTAKWQVMLTTWGRALAAGSLPSLIRSLQQASRA
jgi:Zn-dependent peptidase ImmA (M78 family)